MKFWIGVLFTIIGAVIVEVQNNWMQFLAGALLALGLIFAYNAGLKDGRK